MTPARTLWLRSAAAVALLGFLALRAAAIPRAAFNWDELALFDLVARTLQDGVLRSGGRPGLTQLIVMPLVDACSDEARAAQLARYLWLAITTSYLAGLFALLMELFRGRAHRLHDACLGVALLAGVPAFLEWSLQVRTDQIALAGATWGGVALLRSERNTGLALAAGLAFGVGWLSSQKLAYAAALVGFLALAKLPIVRSLSLQHGVSTPAGFCWQREGWRAVLAIAGFGTVLLCFRATVMWLFTLPESHAALNVLGAQLASAHQNAFPFYRNTIGYGQYAAILPTLIPHAVLGVGLVVTTLFAWRDREGGWIAAAWGVLALGTLVGLYHAAAFAYFWMTLGLFPAVAGAIAAGEIRDRMFVRHPRWLRPAAAALWLGVALPAGVESLLLLRDTQAVQRQSLAFVHRNFTPGQSGFHPEGGVFCRPPQPLGIWFSQRIYTHFESPERHAHAERVEAQFRSQPVHYLVESFRLNQFPIELRRFWADHYQPYRDSIFVAGRRLEGRDGAEQPFELLVAGSYRWLPLSGQHAARVNDRALVAGEIVELPAGDHAAVLPAGKVGLLVLSLGDPPGPAPLAFYGSG